MVAAGAAEAAATVLTAGGAGRSVGRVVAAPMGLNKRAPAATIRTSIASSAQSRMMAAIIQEGNPGFLNCVEDGSFSMAPACPAARARNEWITVRQRVFDPLAYKIIIEGFRRRSSGHPFAGDVTGVPDCSRPLLRGFIVNSGLGNQQHDCIVGKWDGKMAEREKGRKKCL